MDNSPKTTLERINELLGNHNWRYSDKVGAITNCGADRPYATWQASYLTSTVSPVCMSAFEWNNLHLRGILSAIAIPLSITTGIVINKNRSLERKVVGALIGGALGCLAWIKLYPASV